MAMRSLGKILIAVGVTWLVIAFNMDTSVPVPSGALGLDRVNNMGLMAERQNHLMVASLITLIGVLLTIFGGERRAQGESQQEPATIPFDPPFERDLTQDPYRLWLAEKYGIQRNDLFNKFVFNSQTYSDLDAALASAHEADVERSTQALVDEEARRAETRSRAQDGAITKMADRLVAGLLIIVAIVIAYRLAANA